MLRQQHHRLPLNSAPEQTKAMQGCDSGGAKFIWKALKAKGTPVTYVADRLSAKKGVSDS